MSNLREAAQQALEQEQAEGVPMTRDDIIRMAREAGFEAAEYGLNCTSGMYAYNMKIVERFAALVISHHVKENRPKPNATERERLQQIAYQHGGIGDLCRTELEFGAMVAAAEREACAKVCDEMGNSDTNTHAWDAAAAIRARGADE